MRIEYIKFLKKKPEKMLMKHLRDDEQKAERRREIRESYFEKRRIIFNKNRVALVAISLMLVTASYWNYLNKTKLKISQLGDATFVSSEAVMQNQNEYETENIETNTNSDESKNVSKDKAVNESQNEDENKSNSNNFNAKNEEDNKEETSVETSTEAVAKTEESNKDSNYFAKIKLDREKMFSQMIDSYESILENSNIEEENKKIAADEIKNINDRKNAITTIENLLKGKGFDEIAVLINDNSINVIARSEEKLKDEQVAQISNIVSRELNTNIEKIHITTHK